MKMMQSNDLMSHEQRRRSCITKREALWREEASGVSFLQWLIIVLVFKTHMKRVQAVAWAE